MALAVVNASETIGRLVIVKMNAMVEHDCQIDDAVPPVPGSRLGGAVSVGCSAPIEIGSVITPGSSVGTFAVIGAGSTIIEYIGGDSVATGSPAKVWQSI